MPDRVLSEGGDMCLACLRPMDAHREDCEFVARVLSAEEVAAMVERSGPYTASDGMRAYAVASVEDLRALARSHEALREECEQWEHLARSYAAEANDA